MVPCGRFLPLGILPPVPYHYGTTGQFLIADQLVPYY
jgi:hypothetical protein